MLAALICVVVMAPGFLATFADISGTLYIPDIERIPPLTLLLNEGDAFTYARYDGNFKIPSVSMGHYLLSIPSETYRFHQYAIDVLEDGSVKVFIRKFLKTYPSNIAVEYPLAIEPLSKINHFETREQFNVLQLIMSPSFLTIALPVGLMYLLPKLSKSMMDPEELKRAQEEMGAQNPQALLQGMFGGGANSLEDSDEE